MKHYDYQQQLHHLWKHATTLYKAEERDLGVYFTSDEVDFLSSIGMRPREVYDFAEDYIEVGEPDFATVVLIQQVRRQYFLIEQKGVPSERCILADDIPSGEEAFEGIVWLPRIAQKAQAKLRGELEPDLMYNCGRDRRFFKEHDVHPSDFLAWVWELGSDPKQLAERLRCVVANL